jgi:DNA-binding transcriptional MerR regulator/methylmalonyl-CoA mutase cobalamin-binding subunit
MKEKPAYTMKYVAIQTGLKPYLIRSWESRYNAICPERSATRHRCFTGEDIKRLNLLKQAVHQGHSISAVAKMSNDHIMNLLGQGVAAIIPEQSSPDARRAQPSDHEATAAQIVEKALSHVMQLDASSLEHVLNDAAVDMSRQYFLQFVILPLFERIGELWRVGKMKIVNEHMASLIVRSILWEMLRSVEISKEAPRIVVATPVGHWHEFGALASALAASESGWRVSYFGPNLPSEEMAYAVKRLKAKALALSLCHLLNDNRLLPELKKLRRLVGSELTIFIGGPGAGIVRKMKVQIDAIVGVDLTEFRRVLENLAQKQ